MKRLENKIAIVTGAAQGVGEAVVDLFVQEGAQVVALDIQGDKLAENVKKYGDKVVSYQLDVSSHDQWAEVVKKVIDQFGRIDILINNAGVMANKGLLDATESDLDWVYNINAKGPIFGMQTVIPHMQSQGGGSIVNVSSVAALSSGMSDGGDIAYSLSKGALQTASKHVAYYFAKDNIRCNTINPAGILTPLIAESLEKYPEAAKANAINSPLAPHMSQPEDVAQGILYLASDAAPTVTGAQLLMDNGMLSH